METKRLALLAIDDHQDNLVSLKAVIGDAFPDAWVLTALNGGRGIELARAEDPDVILLDIVMPGMDGFEVCRHLKEDARLQHIPVVFLTALKTDRESRIKALEAGAEAFLSKPIDEMELTAQIRAMVKIKEANNRKRLEKEQLAALVDERTRELQQMLIEKESMLKEIHHRVKNNLQIVSSLLRLKSAQIECPDAQSVLKDMQNRVRSMALIHEHLYRSDNLAQVDLAAYLEQLCTQIFRSLVSQPGTIQIRMDLVPVRMGIDRAIPCGLLVNELVTNSLKHAFPDGRSGEVRVELQYIEDSHTLRLRIKDNGVGLPAEFDPKKLTSLGLQLVPDLAHQMDGQFEIHRGEGESSGGRSAGGIFDVVFKVAIDEVNGGGK